MTNLRYALRGLSRSPGFVTIAVLALGVGLGLSTTMFAVLDAVVNPFVAYARPGELYSVNWWFGRRNPMSAPELYRYLRDQTRSFEIVAPAAWGSAATLQRDNGEPMDVGIRQVSPKWFTLTGIRPERGRVFTASDEEDVIVLSHDLWRRLYGMRRSVDGLTLTISGKTVTVVGVLPRGSGGGSAWMPLPKAIETTDIRSYVRPWVRLRAGVTAEQAGDELKTMARELTQRFNATEAPFAFELNPVVSRREDIKDIHKAMVGSALAVLLIACVNLAHLMMTRGLAKRRELALRMALGASRATVISQMFLECAIITAGGAAIGGLIAYWCADLLQNRMPPEVAWIGLVRPQLSWRVFALSGLTAVVSAIAFGLIPAVRVAFGLNLDDPLKDDSGTTTGRVRYRYNPLVVVEVALALVLMMGGGLLLRTVRTVERERADINTETLWRGWFYTPQRTDSSAPRPPSRQTVEATIRGVPGILEVAFESGRSLMAHGGAVIGEQTEDSTRMITKRYYSLVSPSYLKVLGLPILQGRDFEPGDGAGPGVAIVDAYVAQKLYPGQQAVGHMLKLGSASSTGRWVRIIGVARALLSREGDDRYVPQPSVWVAMPDSSPAPFVVRTASPDPKISAVLVRQLRQLPGVGVAVYPFDFSRRAELASRGFLAKVFVTMGAVALGLAALGLYGVLAYAVTRRMREFAVRVALGAEPRALLKMVLHDGFVMLLGGIGVGAFLALASSRLLDSVLITVLPSDVTSLVLCEVVLISVGLAAALGPARRASQANPMDILRAV